MYYLLTLGKSPVCSANRGKMGRNMIYHGVRNVYIIIYRNISGIIYKTWFIRTEARKTIILFFENFILIIINTGTFSVFSPDRRATRTKIIIHINNALT